MEKRKRTKEKRNCAPPVVKTIKKKKNASSTEVVQKKKRKSEQAAIPAPAPAQEEVIKVKDDGELRGMRKWIAEYKAKRPGTAVLQKQLDDFMADYDEREEQARKERDAAAAADGWTVVGHNKGRKKSVDASGVAVGGVAAAAVARKNAEKKEKVASDFYRFQRREARRNEVLELQLKFEEDKKRIAQLRAARKFRPY